MTAVTIDEGLEKLQEYSLEFLKFLHAYIMRVEERKTLYRELRRAALAIGLTEAELPPPLEKTRGGNRHKWTDEQRAAAADRMRRTNAAKSKKAR
jgi:Fic family protein